MRLIRETKPGRQAFTLIEMVIVIAIILIAGGALIVGSLQGDDACG